MQTKLDPENIPRIKGARVALLQAKWYREYIDRMVDRTIELLEGAGSRPVEKHVLPGSLELPLAAKYLLKNTPPDEQFEAVIVFGAILKGETDHYEMIRDECARGFGEVMLSEQVPIIMEVIPITEMEQLEARSRDDEFNKGIEAALATAEIIEWRRGISTSSAY